MTKIFVSDVCTINYESKWVSSWPKARVILESLYPPTIRQPNKTKACQIVANLLDFFFKKITVYNMYKYRGNQGHK